MLFVSFAFHVRIEMKQIGARQEAGRIGGIGPCGRPLCCAQWMTTFKSVNTAAARYQDLTLNPEKLTGQCAKLKCCTNFEVNAYVEAQKRMPPRDLVLETEEGSFYFFKWDLLKGEVTYTAEKNRSTNACTITTRRAREVIEMNRRGEKPATLLEERYIKKPVSLDILDENLLTRFDDKGRKRRKGNANAFRLLTHRFLGRREGGFVMTYSTLASIVKYPFSSTYASKHGKFGFFATEEETYKKIADELGIIQKDSSEAGICYVRHPLTYLMEAADDICYEIMDIEDSHKLKLLSFR